jgi:hypothetical protein
MTADVDVVVDVDVDVGVAGDMRRSLSSFFDALRLDFAAGIVDPVGKVYDKFLTAFAALSVVRWDRAAVFQAARRLPKRATCQAHSPM